MIDLCSPSFMFNAQVMNYCPVLPRVKIKINVIGGVFFSLHAFKDVANFVRDFV